MNETGSNELRERYDVPDGVALRVDRGTVLAWVPGYEDPVRAVATGLDSLPRADVGGRAALARIDRDEGPLLVRMYRKGGHLRTLRGARFHGPLRPLQELALHRRLRAAGVPVLEAVGAVVHRSPLGWSGSLLTREIEGAIDFEAWLYGVRNGNELSDTRTLRRAGRAVRTLHDAGVSHADLHPKNLLVDPAGEVYVIDLDRAWTAAGRLDDERRLTNLVRLGRAIEKHRLKGMTAGRRSALRFLEGYAGDRAAASQWLDRIRARLRRGLGMRRLWWRLTGEARPWSGWRHHGAAVREAGS